MKTPRNIYALVMAGGQGTRLWPASTQNRPKQYLSLSGNHSLLHETLLRFGDLIPAEKRFLVTLQEQKEPLSQYSRKLLLEENIIFEPEGKNTAPCILLALATLLNKGLAMDDVLFICPADHLIEGKQEFQENLNQAYQIACDEEKIITLGIPPTSPHTGYGYIKQGEKLGECFNVQSFKEKPDEKTALTYLKEGGYYWNGGMFAATLKTFLHQFKLHASGLFCLFDDLKASLNNESLLRKIYADIPSDSIDYAVMEKSSDVLCLPVKFTWNDLGSWNALEEVNRPIDENTLLEGTGHFFKNAKGNIIHAPGKFVSMTNVDNIVVVVTDKTLMVIDKNQTPKIKKTIEYLKKNHPNLL